MVEKTHAATAHPLQMIPTTTSTKVLIAKNLSFKVPSSPGPACSNAVDGVGVRYEEAVTVGAVVVATADAPVTVAAAMADVLPAAAVLMLDARVPALTAAASDVEIASATDVGVSLALVDVNVIEKLIETEPERRRRRPAASSHVVGPISLSSTPSSVLASAVMRIDSSALVYCSQTRPERLTDAVTVDVETGAAVGAWIGSAVGPTGVMVGVGTGTIVGEGTGTADVETGAAVGAGIGSAVGSPGTMFGVETGTTVGVGTGTAVGAGAGTVVGAGTGRALCTRASRLVLRSACDSLQRPLHATRDSAIAAPWSSVTAAPLNVAQYSLPPAQASTHTHASPLEAACSVVCGAEHPPNREFDAAGTAGQVTAHAIGKPTSLAAVAATVATEASSKASSDAESSVFVHASFSS